MLDLCPCESFIKHHLQPWSQENAMFMQLRVVETHKVNPASVCSATLPLTFSDAFWIPFSNTQRLFLYKLPSVSTPCFLSSFLPDLKTSLSLSLHLFFPLAGTFVTPTQPTSRPCIRCEDGCFVTLKIAEATGDWDHLLGTDKKRLMNVTEFHPLVPDLVKDDATGRTSLLALQFTIFPGCGICFGITYNHVVADGRSIAAFLHTWSSICRNSCIVPPDTILPIFDRNLIPDPNGTILDSFLKQLFSAAESKDDEAQKDAGRSGSEAKLRGTFVITKSEVGKLRQWILNRAGNEQLHLSTFVLACSLIWVNLIKSEAAVKKSNDPSLTELCHFGQVVDCRDRYELKSIVPLEYFGNCLTYGCNFGAKRVDLEDEDDGFVVGVRALGNAVKKIELDGALSGAENWVANFLGIAKSGSFLSVSGSPRLGLYGLDFGWGRPKKVEVVSIDASSTVSIAESVDDEGGVEIGLALEMSQMRAFVSIHEDSKSKYCGSVM